MKLLYLFMVHRCWKDIIGSSGLSFGTSFKSLLDNWLFSGSEGDVLLLCLDLLML